MLRIRVLFVGKERRGWVQDAIAEYEKRIKGNILFEWVPCSNEDKLIASLAEEGVALGLDPLGKALTSESFSRLLYDKLEEGGSKLAFVIGGPDGLCDRLKKKLSLVSLSPLTFTHELARVVLAEQIYRAHQIRLGSPYHK